MNGFGVNKGFIGELAGKLADAVPAGADSLESFRADLERNFRSLLAGSFERMDLVTREEFDRQRKVLERTREKLTELEADLETLRASLKQDQSG